MIQIDCHHSAYVPLDEDERQRAVHRSRVLERRQDAELQGLVERAADLFRVPMAAVTIIDGDRQWLVVRTGLEADQTDRAVSFCAHAILEPGKTLVVSDARRDRRFANNPTVLFAPHIRFYAGVPIVDRCGFALGALCIIDAVPRPAPDNLLHLALLARRAEHIIGSFQ